MCVRERKRKRQTGNCIRPAWPSRSKNLADRFAPRMAKFEKVPQKSLPGRKERPILKRCASNEQRQSKASLLYLNGVVSLPELRRLNEASHR